MEEYPKTLAELEHELATEEACAHYLFQLRWPEGFVCPGGGGTPCWTTKRALFNCARCQYQMSVKAGTIFAGSRSSLVTWFRAIWWVTSQKNGASAKGLQRILGLGSYKTAWTWLHKRRRAMVRPGCDRLAGVVDVDEIYLGGEKPGKRGRGAEGKARGLIAAQVDGERIGRIRLGRVKDASGASLEPAVQETVEPGSIVRTDAWGGYNNLDHWGYGREMVRKNAEVGDNRLPRCHRVAALLQRWLRGTHQGAVSHKHLDYYLNEYTFRFNPRTSRYRGKLFYRLIQQAVALAPVPYTALVKHVRGPKPKNYTI